MGLFEFGRKPVEFSVSQALWLGEVVRRSVSNETGLNNILETWQEPMQEEIAHHVDDAWHTDDMERLGELSYVQRAIDLFAPRDANELDELIRTENLPPDHNDITLLLYRHRHDHHGEA